MNILLDGRFLQGKRNGISNDSLAILETLVAQGHQLFFLIFGNQNTDSIKKYISEDNQVKVRAYRYELIKSLFFVPLDLSRLQIDLYFQFQVSPIKVLLRTGAKKIIRIHDLFPLTNPEWFAPRSRFFFRLGFRNLSDFDLFLANSKTTAMSLKNYFNGKSSNIKVLPCFVSTPIDSELCGSCSFCNHPVETKGAYFAVGTMEPRKNYRTLIHAFSIASENFEGRLIIVGGKGWGKVDLPNFRKSSISIYEDVCEGAIQQLYQNAKTFITVSFNEGFNIPLYNAFEMGKRVIASDIPIHHELANGRDVRWVNPHILQSLVDEILTNYADQDVTHRTDSHTDYFEELRKILCGVSQK